RVLELPVQFGTACRLAQVFVGLDQEAAGAAGRVEDALAQLRGQPVDDKAYNWARRVELPRVSRRVAHLAQHTFVEVRDGVDILRGVEVDAAQLVHYLAKDVAGAHAVIGSMEACAGDRADIVIAGSRVASQAV